MTLQNPLYYDSTQKAHLPFNAGDQVLPAVIPVSAALGNQVQVKTDGLFVGQPNGVILYVSNTGTDSPTSGSKTAPFQTVQYALTAAAAMPASQVLNFPLVIALRAGQTFVGPTADVNLYPGSDLTIAFYNDTNYGDFNSPPIGTGAIPAMMSDLARPILTFNISTLSPWALFGFNRLGGNITFEGVQLNLPIAPSSPSIALYGNSIDIVRSPNGSQPGYVNLLGAVVNMTDITAYWGFLGIQARSLNTYFTQYGSQFQIQGIVINASTVPAPSTAVLTQRQYFIKFFLDVPGNNQGQGFLQTSGSNSSSNSGVVASAWADTEQLVVATGKTNQPSAPIAFDLTWGLRNYIFNRQLDQQSRSTNFLNSRLI